MLICTSAISLPDYSIRFCFYYVFIAWVILDSSVLHFYSSQVCICYVTFPLKSFFKRLMQHILSIAKLLHCVLFIFSLYFPLWYPYCKKIFLILYEIQFLKNISFHEDMRFKLLTVMDYQLFFHSLLFIFNINPEFVLL